MTEELPKLPEGWVWTKLGESVDVLDSMRVPINSTERKKRISGKSEDALYPYYGATGQVGWIDDYLFDEELVLLGEDGAPFLDITKNKAYIIQGKTWVNNHAHVLRAISKVLSNKLLCHYLNIVDYTPYITGTTRFKLNQSEMRKISLPLPPLHEQHEIVRIIEEKFSSLDHAVEELKQAKEQLKTYRQSVLKCAFEGKLTAEWREEHKGEMETAEELLERIKRERAERYERELEEWKKALKDWEEEGKQGKKPAKPKKPKESAPLKEEELKALPKLPDGWGWSRIGEISQNIQYGYTESSSKIKVGPKFLRITDIQNSAVNWDTVPYCKIDEVEKEKYLLKEGDLLFARTGATVGKSYLIKGKIPESIFASYLIRVRLSEKVDELFIYNFFKSIIYWKQITEGQVGTGQPNVNGTKLSQLILPLPPLPEQKIIVSEIERRLSVADKLAEEIDESLKKAEILRQSILKKAFEGELTRKWREEHPELITGENSAEALLEKIRSKKERANKGKKGKRGRKRRNEK